MSDLDNAVKALISSYGDIRAEAKTYQFNLSDVNAALAKVDADTAEGVVLNLLLQNAIDDTPVKTKKG